MSQIQQIIQQLTTIQNYLALLDANKKTIDDFDELADAQTTDYVTVTRAGVNKKLAIGKILEGVSLLLSDKETFIATASQTAFVLSDSPSNVDVYRGRNLMLSSEYTYDSPSKTVTTTTGMPVGTEINVRKFY